MKILFVTAEAGPFVSVGGLSQVSYFLPNALKQAGDDVRIFTPKFGAMDRTAKGKQEWQLTMEVEGLRVPQAETPSENDLICNVKSYQTEERAKTYFLENREYYELRANVFGYKDDHVRFLLMCKGCLEWLLLQKEKGKWFPDVIHCNDWHSAYLIELARKVERYREALAKTKIVLTVHNFVFQGNYDFKYSTESERDTGKAPLVPLLDPRLQKQNPLLRGLLYADAITTVSPTHAREVLTEEYGEGLHTILFKRKKTLSGILNGLDVHMFNPAKDKILKRRFSAAKFVAERRENKAALQKLFGLPVKPGTFLLAYSGRLSQQKGVTTIIEMMPHLLLEYPQVQLVVLGGGDDEYRQQLTALKALFPRQVGLHLLPNFRLPRKIFAGADCLLMPSAFEPGGIVALEALRYGAVPIVRRTGGLNDIIEDFHPVTGRGNGFSFEGKGAWSLYGAVMIAMATFINQKLWHKLVKNCLQSDFSWDFAASEYQKWYRQVRIET